MNIHDIQISKITAQYLDYLHKLEELDVDVSSEFIYMAATLIYIKSKMLLPPDPLAGPEEAEDPRADLVQRVVEAGQVALPRRRDRGRFGGIARGFGESVPAGAGAAEGSFANRVAARRV